MENGAFTQSSRDTASAQQAGKGGLRATAVTGTEGAAESSLGRPTPSSGFYHHPPHCKNLVLKEGPGSPQDPALNSVLLLPSRDPKPQGWGFPSQARDWGKRATSPKGAASHTGSPQRAARLPF